MTPLPEYALVFAPETIGHLAAIERQYHSLIQEKIQAQLTHTPTAPTRNRKQLTQPAPFGASWEIRFGDRNQFRVFYRIVENEMAVRILAIGVKERGKLYIGKQEFKP